MLDVAQNFSYDERQIHIQTSLAEPEHSYLTHLILFQHGQHYLRQHSSDLPAGFLQSLSPY
jgi:hypothetical protein